ncbi:unnamed protein product [Mytilus coruscus]|uniref:Uncharacterized protein n=1 Tax=Mytilus coruscus TaxID=42192 RepID=A0A6J8DMS8_MYTCO|nr:unnamed protein product [Mytilus coruscus]
MERLTIPIDTTSSQRENLKPLPEHYTIVPPVVLPKEPAEIPTVHGPMISDGTEIPRALNLEYSRLDVVWDEYFSNSLKASTRCKRGKGVRRRVLPDSRVPGNWEEFLRINDNKTELFTYLAEQLVASATGYDEQKQVITTKEIDVLCRLPKDVSCDQVSSFAYKAKKTAWDTGTSFGEITPMSEILSRPASPNVISNFMLQKERSFIVNYNYVMPQTSTKTAFKRD